MNRNQGKTSKARQRRMMPDPVLLVFLLLFFFAHPLHAYADPGSGILLWQLLLAGLAGVVYHIRCLLRRRSNASNRKTEPTPRSGNEAAHRS